MLKVLSYILCDLDPKVKVGGQKAGICDGVPSTSALVISRMVVIYRQKPVSTESAQIIRCERLTDTSHMTEKC